MMIKGKRGDITFILEVLISIVVGVAIVVFIYLSIIPKINELAYGKVDCDNSVEWDKIQTALENADAGKEKQEFFFYNGGKDSCKLASFSPRQLQFSVFAKNINVEKPTLCLCQMQGSVCQAHKCKTLNNFERVENDIGAQVSTTQYNPYMFLEFVNNGNRLTIKQIGKQLKYTAWRYNPKSSENQDPQGFLNKLELQYAEQTPIKSIAVSPVVLNQQVVPEEYATLPKMQDFPQIIEIKLMKQKLFSEETETLSPSVVKTAEIELLLPKASVQSLPEELRKNMQVYYFRSGNWLSAKADCTINHSLNEIFVQEYRLQARNLKLEQVAICKASLNGFAEKIALSAEEITEEGQFNEETPLTSNLQQIQTDDHLQCAEKIKSLNRCKLVPAAADQLAKIKEVLNKDEKVIVVSAARSVQDQIQLFQNEFEGKTFAPVCGPREVMQGKPLRQVGEANEIYQTRLKLWVDQTLPKVQSKIQDTNNYQKCPHVAGKAVDIYLTKNGNLDTSEEAKARVRVVMCSIGWVNYAKEFWHFEYLTPQWEKKQPDLDVTQIQGGADKYPSVCSYGGTVQNVV
ncbi:hypothetical protein HZB00_01065 [Candidatus Woesearchaeota archaeon]|nr:hypothetical protein [Candidatus Woesearchaeota archaeon]